MPQYAVQRGTLKTKHGDVLTPLYPSRYDLFKSKTIKEVVVICFDYVIHFIFFA